MFPVLFWVKHESPVNRSSRVAVYVWSSCARPPLFGGKYFLSIVIQAAMRGTFRGS